MTPLQKVKHRIDNCNSNFLSLANLGLTSEDLLELIPLIKEKLPNIKRLDLSNNNFTSLPDSIGDFIQLEELDASNNQLEKLPKSIGDLSALKKLNLANNSLKRLPTSIRKITSVGMSSSLKRLDLTNNDLKRIPWNLGDDMRFGGLILDNNSNLLPVSRALEASTHILPTVVLNILIKHELTKRRIKAHKMGGVHEFEIEERISAAEKGHINSTYKYLDLSGLNLTNEKVAQLIPRIAKISDLKSLDLSSNNLTELDENIGMLTQLLEELHLGNNAFKILPESIGNLRNLGYLGLSVNGFISLPESIRNLSSLRVLALDNNIRINLTECLRDLSNSISIRSQQGFCGPSLSLSVDKSLSLRNFISLSSLPLNILGLNRKLSDPHGEFIPTLKENFMTIAEMVVDSCPNTSISVDEFLTLFESLDANQKKGILEKSISLSELDFNFEENNTQEQEINISPDLETLTSPLLSAEIKGTIPSSLENRARQRRKQETSLLLNSDGDKKPAANKKMV